MSTDFAEKWNLLHGRNSQNGDVPGIPSITLDVGTNHGLLRFALGENDLPRLLIPVDMREKISDRAGTQGLRLSTTTLRVLGKPVKFIDLVCIDSLLDQVFRELAEDIVRRVGKGSGAVISVTDAIREFRQLVIRKKPEKIPLEKTLGLLGELYLLEKIVRISPASLRAWKGPLGGRHDFANGLFAAEVKTSMRAQKEEVTIHGIDQLIPVDKGSLCLAHLVVEENMDGPLFIPDLVKKIMMLCGNESVFEETLLACEYDMNDADAWGASRFSVFSWKCYEVRDGFPRLVPSLLEKGQLSSGVSHVTYRLDLGCARDFLLDATSEDHHVKGLAGCL